MKVKFWFRFSRNVVLSCGAVVMAASPLTVAQTTNYLDMGGRVSCYSLLDSQGNRKSIGCEVGTLLVLAAAPVSVPVASTTVVETTNTNTELATPSNVAALPSVDVASVSLVSAASVENTTYEILSEDEAVFIGPSNTSEQVVPAPAIEILIEEFTPEPIRDEVSAQPETGSSDAVEDTVPIELVGLSSVDIKFAPLPAGMDEQFEQLFQNGWCEGGEESDLNIATESTCVEGSVFVQASAANQTESAIHNF